MVKRKADICIVGGAGRVGLPLAVAFADTGAKVIALDINKRILERVRRGEMPYREKGAGPLLKKVLAKGRLILTSEAQAAAEADTIIVTIGTPIDEFLNPRMALLADTMEPLLPYLSDDQLLVLRSTVFPGTTEWLNAYLRRHGRRTKVAFCPERIIEGKAIEELRRLPQIVSGMSKSAEDAAARLFKRLAPVIVRLSPKEAEFAKLFCNAHRYIEFAVTNQFYMMANAAGLDYYRILDGVKHRYTRMDSLPTAGFSAGPCLLKDTMQLAASYDNDFSLGHAAMRVNERLPVYVANQMALKYDLSRATVGLLGMSFKRDSDDPRSSLSYKLKKILTFRAKRVLTTDPYVADDPDLLPLGEVVRRSKVLVLCTPHEVYRKLKRSKKPVIDVWNFMGRGGLV